MLYVAASVFIAVELYDHVVAGLLFIRTQKNLLLGGFSDCNALMDWSML